MRKHFLRTLAIFMAVSALLIPGRAFSRTEGTVPGLMEVYLYESGTGSSTGGVSDIVASIGDTISVDVFVRNDTREKITIVEVYLTVDDTYFNIVHQGEYQDGTFKPFIRGTFMRAVGGNSPEPRGNWSHGESTDPRENGLDGWQLDYTEITPPAPTTGGTRPSTDYPYGVVCTFKLIPKTSCTDISPITFDYDAYEARISRYKTMGAINNSSYAKMENCTITVIGARIDPPLPDITMAPGTTNSSLDLDDHIEVPSVADSIFVWSYESQKPGGGTLSVSIDPTTHVVTFVAPGDFRGYEDIKFTVGDQVYPALDSAIMRVMVGMNPSFIASAIPDTLFIYEDSLQVALHLPDIVEDLDNEFDELEWAFSTGGSVTYQVANDDLKLQGVQNFYGFDYLVMEVSDDLGLGDSVNIPVRVYSVNDPPVLTDLPDVTFERTKEYSFDMMEYAGDVDGDNLTIEYEGGEHFLFIISGSTVTINEQTGFLGSEEVVFTVSDPSGASASDTITITVTPLFEPPVWTKIPKTGFPQNQSFSNMTLWDYVEDPDGDDSELTFEFSGYDDVDSIYVGTQNGRLFLYDLDDTPGWDMMTVTAIDFDGNEAETTFLVFIGPSDGTPITAAIPDTTIQAGTLVQWIDLDDYYYDVDNSDNEMVWTFAHADDDSLVIPVINPVQHTVMLTTVNPDSSGVDQLIFTVTDPDDNTASDDCFITVIGEVIPLLDLPPIFGFVAGTVKIINLDDYAYDPEFPNSELTWRWSGNSNILIGFEDEHTSYTRPLHFTSLSDWTGFERVHFVTENPFGGKATDSTLVFSVPDDGSPVAGGLGPVRIRAGYCDSLDIDLDDYYWDEDTTSWGMTWTVSGNDSIAVTIDPGTHKVKFCAPSLTFEGQETITLTVSDGVHSNSMDVVVTVYGAILRNVFTMTLFRNPMQSDYMDIYVRSTTSLIDVPSLEVQVRDDTTRVTMRAIADTLLYYHGSYVLPYDASLGIQSDAVVLAGGVSRTGKTVEDTLSFSYGRFGAPGGKLTLGSMEVVVPEGALEAPEILTLAPAPVEESAGKTAQGEITFQGQAYTLGPVSLTTSKPMDVGFAVCCRTDGIGIYRAEHGGWEFVGGTLAGHRIYGESYTGGTYRLGYDRTPPKIRSVSSDEGMVVFSVTDFGSGVDVSSIAVMFEGRQLACTYDAERSVCIVPFDGYGGQEHVSLEISVADRVGNTRVQTLNTAVGSVPGLFFVDQNMPNPFNPSTAITFTTTSDQKLKLEVYDILGRRIKVLADGYFTAGKHRVVWDATDSSGRTVSSGMYLYSVIGDSKIVTRKMVFIR